MKKKIVNKIGYHMRGWKYAVAFMVFVSFSPIMYQNIQQSLVDTSYYYEYSLNNPVEVLSGNKVGENLLLQSNVVYKKPIDMTWWDTLYCN